VSRSRPRVVVLCPHYRPDTAPTGDVITGIVEQLGAADLDIHVVTTLPWYRQHRVDADWQPSGLTGWVRRERTTWGSITRVYPFPGNDKANVLRRALGFAASSVLMVLAGWWVAARGARAVIAMAPPPTMGLAGWMVRVAALVANRGRLPTLIYNVQDIFPDAAIETGAITNARVIAVARAYERWTYRRADVVTVVGESMRANVVAKLGQDRRDRVRMIPNFVDVDAIAPRDRMTALRAEFGVGDHPVVMYAGNVGYSQSLDVVVEVARRTPQAMFVINGEGSALAAVRAAAADCANVMFGPYQPKARLAEVLATGDIHLVPLRAGLGSVSVPSKTYSILAAGRPVVAAIDLDSDVPALLRASGGGISVGPDDAEALTSAIHEMLADPTRQRTMGAAGRAWAASNVSVDAIAAEYRRLVTGN
jgi:colanic acid biosynthesis glycosyl transferase WcaI